MSDYKVHDDSQGKHSDEYNGALAYTTNISDPPPAANVPKDVLAIEVKGKHRGMPVPDFAHTASLLMLALLAVGGINAKQKHTF